jgi:hypothetical protein
MKKRHKSSAIDWTRGDFDSYDLWATAIGVRCRSGYYNGHLLSRAGAMAIMLGEWLAPALIRRLCRIPRKHYPISWAHRVMVHAAQALLDDADSCSSWPTPGDAAIQDCIGSDQAGWGLPFDWMSKNGFYPAGTPFVTHSPYVMAAMRSLAALAPTGAAWATKFLQTRAFLSNLPLQVDESDRMAVAYSPRRETRIVTNATSYAAWAWAQHAASGEAEGRDHAIHQVLRCGRWISDTQTREGGWTYYADNLSGNFIDGFHTCLVIRNLSWAERLIGEPVVEAEVLERGTKFIRDHLIDQRTGLVKRFYGRGEPTPFRWDLYDQAEWLAVLTERGTSTELVEFCNRVHAMFSRNGSLHSRVDVLGRRSGSVYPRWGILPWTLHCLRSQVRSQSSPKDVI